MAADDSGPKAFLVGTDPGSAGYVLPMPQDRASTAAAPAAAVERLAPRHRVAAARTPRTRVVAIARHETAHRTVMAAHRAAPHYTMHAMHRTPGAERGQS